MDKKTVHSTINQLVNAYRLHLKASNQSPIQNSSARLLFYAVECGLKARYLGIKRLNSTEDLIRYFSSKKPYGHNHDINKWGA